MTTVNAHCVGGPLDGRVFQLQCHSPRLTWPEADEHDGEYLRTLFITSGPLAIDEATYTWTPRRETAARGSA